MMGRNKIARALIILLLVAYAACAMISAADQTTNPPNVYLATMETKDEVTTYGNDGTGAKFKLDTVLFFEGKSSVSILPNGKAPITRLTIPLVGEQNIKAWIATKYLAINVFIPDKQPLLAHFYLALVDVTDDLSIIETVPYNKLRTPALTPGAWNTIQFDVTDSYLKEIPLTGKYSLFFSFIANEGGKNIPLKYSFNLDGVYLIMPEPPQETNPNLLWSFETPEEVAKCGADGSGTSFAINTDFAWEGKSSVKITPDGNHIESKMALDLVGDNTLKWNGHKEIVVRAYIPENCTLTNYFLGMGDCNNGWAWVDGVPGAKTGTTGWNEIHIPLSPKMRNIKVGGKYQLYFIFWGTDKTGAKINLTEPFYIDAIELDPIDYLLQMESQEEIAKYGSDNSGTTFALDTDVVYQGKSSVKVTPDGNHIESKVAIDLGPDLMAIWNGRQELVENVYVPDNSNLTNCFLGMGDCNNGWAWVDGIPATQTVQKGWNEVRFPLSEKMKNLKANGKYQIYLIFWGTDASGAKVNLTAPFNIDCIYLIPSIEYLWTMDTEEEKSKYGSDNSGTTFALSSDIVFQGKASVEVIPDGNHIESKVAIDLTGDRTKMFAGHNLLYLNVYVAEESTLTDFFLGMGDTNSGWAWVDGQPAPAKLHKGWNAVRVPLSPAMQKVIINGKYQLYLIFWGTDASGSKINLTTPFYIDGLYMGNAQ